MTLQLFNRPTLPETDIHDILRNERRRHVIEHLKGSNGTVTLRDLAEAIAERETGTSPPPRNIRESVYNSLHQTHLPKLDRRDVIAYDEQRKTITLLPEARNLDVYMEVTNRYGITWGEYYRALGVLALMTVLAAELSLPLIADVGTLAWTSIFLAIVAISTTYQLWTHRWVYLRQIVD